MKIISTGGFFGIFVCFVFCLFVWGFSFYGLVFFFFWLVGRLVFYLQQLFTAEYSQVLDRGVTLDFFFPRLSPPKVTEWLYNLSSYLAFAKLCEPATPLSGYRENCCAKNHHESEYHWDRKPCVHASKNIQSGLYSMIKKQDLLIKRPFGTMCVMVYSSLIN